MKIHEYAYQIPDGAIFYTKHGVKGGYILKWNDNSPELWTVYFKDNGSHILDDYHFSSLHSCMENGATINGKTLKQLQMEAECNIVCEDDVNIDLTAIL